MHNTNEQRKNPQMDRAKIKCKMPYREKLNKAAKKRYFNQVKEMNGLDPYKHSWGSQRAAASHISSVFSCLVCGVKKQGRRS